MSMHGRMYSLIIYLRILLGLNWIRILDWLLLKIVLLGLCRGRMLQLCLVLLMVNWSLLQKHWVCYPIHSLLYEYDLTLQRFLGQMILWDQKYLSEVIWTLFLITLLSNLKIVRILFLWMALIQLLVFFIGLGELNYYSFGLRDLLSLIYPLWKEQSPREVQL